MDISIGPAKSKDVGEIERLLSENQLPTEGLRAWIDSAIVARSGGRVIGCAALEIYPSGVLLRSMVVDASRRGEGLGRQLTDAALVLARSYKAPAVYLLTTTAGDFFPRFGFERVERTDVPDDVKQSIEFTSACPSSALVMRARI